MRLRSIRPILWFLPTLLVCAQSLTAQEEIQKATILSNQVVDEMLGFMGESVRAKDTTVARLVVLAVKFVPPIPELKTSELAIGFGANAKEGVSPSLGATMLAKDSDEGFWLLNNLKAGEFRVLMNVEHTRLLFGLPNDAKEITLFYKKKAIAGPTAVNR